MGAPEIRSGSFSTELGCPRDVQFTPDSDQIADILDGSFVPNKRHSSHQETELA